MSFSIVRRTLRDQRRGLTAWAVALAGLVGMYVAVYPSVSGNSSFAKMIEQMPKAYRTLFTTGSGIDFTTPAGYLNTELLTFMGPLLVLVYAIGAGAAALAGEEDRGTMDLLLANPVSRSRVVGEKFIALVIGTAALMVVLWLALVGEGRAAGMGVPLGRSGAALLHLGLLGVEFGTLALLIGAFTGRLAASRAIPAVSAVTAYLVNGLGPLVGWLRPLRKGSPFFQYIGHDPLRTGVSGLAAAVALVSIAALLTGALMVFRRRDLGA